MLPGAEEVARPAQIQIRPGDLEAVGGLAQGLEPREGFGVPIRGKEDAVGLRRAAPDAAPELVELAQTEAVCVLHHHQGRVRHVHAHLDHGGRNQNIIAAVRKGAHDLVLLGALHPPVDQGHAQIREDGHLQGLGPDLCRFQALGLSLLNGGTDDVDLVALCGLLADEGVDPRPHILAHQEALNLLAARRELVDHRNVQIAVKNHGKGPGDRRGGHH